MADRYWVGPGIKADGFDNRDATSSTAALSNATTADNAAYRMTGDMELIVKAQSPDWTPAAIGVLALSGNNSSANTLNWQLFISPSGIPSFRRGIASGDRLFSASVGTGFTDGTTPYWIKVEYKQNNGGVSEVKFYTSTDGSIFTQLGSTLTNADTSAGISNTTGLFVGNGNSTQFPFNGTISRVTVKNGVGGTIVYDADFEAATIGAATFTESSSNGFTVTMNGNAEWNATAGTKWATTSGGAGGAAVPTAADDVFFDTYKSNTTISAAGVCRSLNCTGYTGTMTHNASTALTIGDATAGAGNVALKFVAGMTYTITHFSASILFISTSATQQTIDFAGKTSGSVTFNPSSNGSWQYVGAHTAGTNSAVEVARGTVDINGQTCSFGNLGSSGSATRSLTLGSASITVSGVLTFNPATNLTFSGASSTITMTGASSVFTTTGTHTFGTVNFTGSGAPTITGGTLTFGTLTRTGTAVKTDSFVLASSITVSGTFTVNGNSVTNRVVVVSNTVGTPRTITAATVSTSNTDWRDITGAGAGSWNLTAITGLSGDCGGNSGITFTSPTTQTATGTSSFTWSTHGWTSRVPLPQDTAVVSNAFSASQTITMDMPRYGTIDFTGSTGNVAVTNTVSSPGSEYYGHITLRASMGTINLNSGYHCYFYGAAQQNLTMAGNANAGVFNFTIGRSKLQLQDALVFSALGSAGIWVTNSSGHIDTQGFNVTTSFFWLNNSSNVNLLGSSTITVGYSSAAILVDFTTSGSSRVSAASATFVVSTTSTAIRTIALNGVSIGTLTYVVAGSTGQMTITGGGTIGTLNFSDTSNARTLAITSGTTITVTNLNINGTSGKLMTVQSVTASSPFTFSKASGVAYADYISLKDCTGSGGAGFVARASTNVSGNTGWAFPVTAVPAGGNWSSTSTWDSGVVPTASTDVALISTSGAVTIDISAVCRSIDCTGYTATLTQNSSTGFSIGTSTAGAGNVALKFVTGMTYTPLGVAGSASINFISTSVTVQTINFAGKATSGVVINGVGSNYQCTGSWAHTDLNAFTHLTAGTLDLNGQTCTWGTVEIKGTGVKVLAMGSSAISMSRSSVAAWWYSGSNLTVSANTAVITLTGTGAGIRADSTIDWNGLSVVMNAYGNTFTGNQTFGNITKSGTATKLEYLTLAGNITCTGTFTVNGNSVTNRVLVKSSVVGTARTITAATISVSNLDFRDITGAGAGSWNLAAITGLSGDCGGNSGITFTSPTTQTATGTSGFTWSTHGWTSRVPLPQDTASIPNAFTAGQTITMDMPRCGAVSFVGSTGNVAFSAAAAIEIHGSLTLRASMGTFSASSLYFIGPSTHNLTTAGNTLVIASYIQLWRSAVSLQDDLINSASGIYAPSGCIGNIVTNDFNITCTLIQLQTMTPTSPHQFGSSTVTLTLQSSTVVLGFVSAAAVSAASASFVLNGAPAARSALLSGASIGALTFTAGASSFPLTITGASTIGTLTIGGGRTLSLPSGVTTTVTNFITASNANGYVYLAGGSGNYASTPDSAALSMTSDIDIRCKVALDSWASGSIQTLVAKFVFATPNASYWFGVDATGHLQFTSSSDGTAGTVINSVSTAVTGLTAGTVKWVRATFQPNDGAGHNVAKFYTSNDGSNWTQLGSTITNNGATLIFDSTAPLEIGSDNIGTNVIATGKFYNAQVRNNILDNGTGIVFDANFGAKPVGSNTFTESSTNAATVTINGSQAQVGDGRVGLNATTPGSAATLSKASGLVSCNYMSIQDSTATGGAQWYAGAASLNISNNSGWIFSTARDGSFLDFF